MANEIYGSNGANRPPLSLASAVYPGLDCDETPFIDQVARSVRFPSLRWNGNVAQTGRPEETFLAHPWGSAAFGGSWGDFQLAMQQGSRAILSGFGGDEVLFERGVFRDLAAHGNWLTLLRETALAPCHSEMSRSSFLTDALRAALPASVRRVYRWLRPRREITSLPPPWAGERLRTLWERPATAPEPGPQGSHTLRSTWGWLTSPRTWWLTEVQTLDAARRGIQFRFPFLDTRLTQFILAIPFEQRIPGGQMKLLLRKAMRGCLPPKIARRQEVTTFDSHAVLFFRKCLPYVTSTLLDGTWLIAPYIRHEAAIELLETLDSDSLDTIHWGKMGILDKVRAAWNIITFELWLRRLAKGYIL
jgi:hypothetical protein